MSEKRTPLYEKHLELGAKMVPFAGWEMPVQYTQIKAEHKAVRTAAGLFDVSHMGEVFIEGSTALSTLQHVMTNDVSKLAVGKVQYSLMCNENGGIVDDMLIYRLAPEKYLVIPNADNREKDVEWLQAHVQAGTTITDVSDDYALLALQGPKAGEILQALIQEDLAEIGFFQCKEGVELGGHKILISRSGYTGEDGFEIYCSPESAARIWEMILEEGEPKGILPCGLGARDTLRFEARLPLYGQEISETISPLEAKLGFAVKLNKDEDFIGKTALVTEKEAGGNRKLVGIEMIEKGIPRTDYPVYNTEGSRIGVITSGTQSPTLGKNLGLALLDHTYTEIDTGVVVGVRKRNVKAKVVKTPFYKG